MRSGVLYILVCGSPIARDVGLLVDLAQRDGWEVCVITTPDGRKFVDTAALRAQTGHVVRSYYKNPGDHDVLPPADAMIVAPATVNTVNKWAAGITDTLVLGLLVEGYGFGIPTVVMPYTNKVMAMHPSLHDSIAKLRSWGVQVLHGDDVVRLGGPGQNDRFRSQFPWRRALQALQTHFQAADRVEPGARS
ncbi:MULTISPECIES: flavoprotein [Winogradskya]|uniref:flavoprotein n=1 Tax=Winogradskya TaxID=3240235 RepID=UPI0019411953|nr:MULTISPECIES: flavoprotein [Actinoplanes]